MKLLNKFNFACLSIISLLILFSPPVKASDISTVTTTEIESLPNGDIIETIIELDTPSEVSIFSTSKTTSGSKTTRYKSSSGTVLWSVKVYGTFTFNGSSAKCTSSKVTATAPAKSWYISSSSAAKSKNSATAKATAKKKTGTATTETITRSVTLTCSKSGKLS